MTPSSGWARLNESRVLLLRAEAQAPARAWLARCWADGLPVAITKHVVRTDADQLALWRQGRETPGAIVTNAKTAEDTPHGECWRAAFDFCFLVGDRMLTPATSPRLHSWSDAHPWERAGAHGEAVGFEWGGRWRTETFPRGDRPHLQCKDWRDLPRIG